MTLAASSYGKAQIRTLRVHREENRHDIRELSADVILHGAFNAAYTHADNRAVIATDSIKNIVNVVARENVAADTETFCTRLAYRFLDLYGTIDRVCVEARETRWNRLSVDSVSHPHAFTKDGNGLAIVQLDQSRVQATIRSGVRGFTFLKSTGSGWADFFRDRYTTLPETTDRIAATSMDATWLWHTQPADPEAINAAILQAMLKVFATTYSHSIQNSLYRMGEAALETAPEILEIEIACPNKHYLPIDLSPFGLDARGVVFTPTDEPHGQIACTIRR